MGACKKRTFEDNSKVLEDFPSACFGDETHLQCEHCDECCKEQREKRNNEAWLTDEGSRQPYFVKRD